MRTQREARGRLEAETVNTEARASRTTGTRLAARRCHWAGVTRDRPTGRGEATGAMKVSSALGASEGGPRGPGCQGGPRGLSPWGWGLTGGQEAPSSFL